METVPTTRPALTLDDHVRAGHVPPEAVRVADGNDPDPGVLSSYEPAAVPSALTRREPLDLREARRPAQDRLEPILRRIHPERRQPVERDPAASRVEPCFRQTQSGGAVCDMPSQMRVALRRLLEARNLLTGELEVGIGRRQMRHQAHDSSRRLRELGEPPPPHARVQLEVHRNPFRDFPVDDRQLEARVPGGADLMT